MPTFHEFVDYLLDTDPTEYNEHWLPYFLLRTPCCPLPSPAPRTLAPRVSGSELLPPCDRTADAWEAAALDR